MHDIYQNKWYSYNILGFYEKKILFRLIMKKRRKKRIMKNANKLAIISLELAEKYLRIYRLDKQRTKKQSFQFGS